MNIADFEHNDWTKIWSWKWSFLSCTHFGVEYTDLVRFGGRPFVSQSVIAVSKGNSNCWIRQSDRDILGNYLSSKIEDNPGSAIEICTDLKKSVGTILAFIDLYIGKEIDRKIFQDFLHEIVVYYYPHIFVKYVVDYLPPELLEKYLSHFEEARIYAEPVFKRTEDFVEALSRQIANKTHIPEYLIRCLTYEEVEGYFMHQVLPSQKILEQRDKNSFMIFERGKYKIFTGEETKEIEQLIGAGNKENILKGKTGFVGIARGRVRVVLDPAHVDNFQEGDILVAGMTRPDYLPLMKKAAAFVTDGGGVLCHAAIVARELKKPCIIGTEIATQVFKDGDIVEVDADKGIVRKIK